MVGRQEQEAPGGLNSHQTNQLCLSFMAHASINKRISHITVIRSTVKHGPDLRLLYSYRLSQEIPEPARANKAHPPGPSVPTSDHTPSTSCKHTNLSQKSPATTEPFCCQFPTPTKPFQHRHRTGQPYTSGQPSSKPSQADTLSTLWYEFLHLFTCHQI